MAATRPRIVRIEPLGDAALLATLGDDLDLAVNAAAHRLAAALALAAVARPGFGVPIPGHAAVLIPFDPEVVEEAEVRNAIGAAMDGDEGGNADAGPRAGTGSPSSSAGAGALHEIEVAYGGADGPDLAEVAGRLGLTERDVIRLHAGVEYRVLVVGFVPGFPYLGVLPAALELPRRATPRVRVPAGSVAIAGRQCGIYPFETPGGWHLIGRTEAQLWDPAAEPPARLAPGDRVRFVEA